MKMKDFLSRVALTLAISGATVAPSQAGTAIFGSGGNQFTMEFVTIGNPGNSADSTGKPNPVGAVSYEYGIGKFEVSADMINKYNANFGTANSREIIQYSWGSDKPATEVSYEEAARFVNWLNTSTGGSAAYNFGDDDVTEAGIKLWTAADTLDYDPLNPIRSKRATYVLPNLNEWYKAAYYDPNKAGGAGYWDYPTGSDMAPTAVASGTSAGTAVFDPYTGFNSAPPSPADVNAAGGLSPYGVMGLGGNAAEWQEVFLSEVGPPAKVGVSSRGGMFVTPSMEMLSSAFSFAPREVNPFNGLFSAKDEGSGIGFRVLSLSTSAPPVVPEPSTFVIGSILGIGGLIAKRRMKKRSI
jgi:formylglycine-generating enzyme